MHLTSAIKQLFHVYGKCYTFMLLIQIAWILIKLGQYRITYLARTVEMDHSTKQSTSPYQILEEIILESEGRHMSLEQNFLMHFCIQQTLGVPERNNRKMPLNKIE